MSERERILKEYERRKREIPKDRYAIWNPAELFMRFSREKVAIELLHKNNAFPFSETKCLEVGFGKLGWLGTLIGWGVREENLYGIELDKERAILTKTILPKSNLVVGDAEVMPFKESSFDFLIASTLFTSIIDKGVQKRVADEIIRVMKRGGHLLYYDFLYDNPKNPNVKGLKKKEILSLFSGLKFTIKKLTLAPPLARLICPISFTLANFLESFPFLRTHIMILFKKE